jgi:hypothetical protein
MLDVARLEGRPVGEKLDGCREARAGERVANFLPRAQRILVRHRAHVEIEFADLRREERPVRVAGANGADLRLGNDRAAGRNNHAFAARIQRQSYLGVRS